VIIKYNPKDQQPQRWNLKDIRILSSEAETIERVTGLEWQEVQAALGKASPRALRAVAWVLLKRSDSTLRHREFDPPVDYLGMRYDAEERDELAATYGDSLDLSEAQRAQVMRELEEMAEEERREAMTLGALEVPGEPAVVEPLTDTVPKASEHALSPTSD
jgi:DNA-binding response OmpR family regulator